jgi:hypothetical protein
LGSTIPITIAALVLLLSKRAFMRCFISSVILNVDVKLFDVFCGEEEVR